LAKGKFVLPAKSPEKCLSVPVMRNQFFPQAFSYPKPYIIICATGFYVTYPAHFLLLNFPLLLYLRLGATLEGREAGRLGSLEAGRLEGREAWKPGGWEAAKLQ